MLVNNTSANLKDFANLESTIHAAIAIGSTELPIEISDLFTLTIIVVNGENRGILNWS